MQLEAEDGTHIDDLISKQNIGSIPKKQEYEVVETIARENRPLVPDNEMLEKSQLEVGDSNYFIQKIITRKSVGNLLVQTAEAADQVMQENVGIMHLSSIADQGDIQREIQRARHRAYNFKHAADRSRNLAAIRKIYPYSQGLWVISQWVTGMSWNEFFSGKALPNVGGILQMLSWAIDISYALIALHRRREVYSGLSDTTIIVNKNRKAMLIDPGFAGHPIIGELLPQRFDPQIDIRAFGDVLFQTLTQQPYSFEPASSFNLAVPTELETLVQKMKEGSVKSTVELKGQLVQVKKGLKP